MKKSSLFRRVALKVLGEIELELIGAKLTNHTARPLKTEGAIETLKNEKGEVFDKFWNKRGAYNWMFWASFATFIVEVITLALILSISIVQAVVS